MGFPEFGFGAGYLGSGSRIRRRTFGRLDFGRRGRILASGFWDLGPGSEFGVGV